MGKTVSAQTEQDILQVIATVNNMARPTTSSKRRVVRGSGGGGSALVYIEITGSTNISTYTGDIFDNPITRTAGDTAVVVRALQHDAGTIPDSSAGQGLWCIFDSVNEVYYPINYSIFMGT